MPHEDSTALAPPCENVGEGLDLGERLAGTAARKGARALPRETAARKGASALSTEGSGAQGR